jgi:hypothetical protein
MFDYVRVKRAGDALVNEVMLYPTREKTAGGDTGG